LPLSLFVLCVVGSVLIVDYGVQLCLRASCRQERVRIKAVLHYFHEQILSFIICRGCYMVLTTGQFRLANPSL
jgi:cytochrome b subunit of formate dehydrogenase